jgi:CheY-like chemotaxis protein
MADARSELIPRSKDKRAGRFIALKRGAGTFPAVGDLKMSGTGNQPAMVLIIDDNPSVILSLKTFLEDHGYQSLCATSAHEGLEMIRRRQPDLILLDIMMEVPHSGFHIFSSMKSDPKLSHIPVIGISGMAERLGIHFCLDTDRQFFDPDAYFEKPVDLDNLLDKIRELIHSP